MQPRRIVFTHCRKLFAIACLGLFLTALIAGQNVQHTENQADQSLKSAARFAP
jgi:hypothetical protein